jgi:hypothetical protein
MYPMLRDLTSCDMLFKAFLVISHSPAAWPLIGVSTSFTIETPIYSLGSLVDDRKLDDSHKTAWV